MHSSHPVCCHLTFSEDGKHSDRRGGRCITAVMMRCFWFSISRKQNLQLCQEFLAFNIHPLEQYDTSGSSGSFGPCWSLGESSRGARSLSLGATQRCLVPRKPQETWGCWQSYLIFPTSASGVKRTKHMDKTIVYVVVCLFSFFHPLKSKNYKTKYYTNIDNLNYASTHQCLCLALCLCFCPGCHFNYRKISIWTWTWTQSCVKHHRLDCCPSQA